MRLRHMTDREIQEYLESFRGHGRVAVENLDSDVREHLEHCSHCRSELREYAHLFSDLACQPQPSLPNAFAYRLLSMLPKHRLVPPVVVVPVTLGWVYCCLVAVVWWIRALNWQAIQTWVTANVIDLFLNASYIKSLWLPSVDIGMYWLRLQQQIADMFGDMLVISKDVFTNNHFVAIIITVIVLLIAYADSGLPNGYQLSRRRTRQ